MAATSNKDEQKSSSPNKRLFAFGDSLTSGYYQYGRAFWPYATLLQQKLGPLFHVSANAATSSLSTCERFNECE
jgi:lysophospholipase L1-like esterase